MAAGGARADWEARIGRRNAPEEEIQLELDAPRDLVATSGVGCVTLRWAPVPGAAGYLVHRADGPDGPFAPVDHFGQDVIAGPQTAYTDTTGERGRAAWYAVAAVASVAEQAPHLSDPVEATPRPAGSGQVRALVAADRPVGPLLRPWRPMIGAERLSLLRFGPGPGGHHVGLEVEEALRRAHEELAVAAVRAHAIFLDELGVYREVDGEPRHDFSAIDDVYDRVRALGLRPIVELSFMPRDLARDPGVTVFEYGAIVSPPKDWDRWADLVQALVAHLVDRYGLDEVRRHWAFEVWNEANLEVFWGGTKEEYFHLYDVTARAVKVVDPELRVGGPATAAAGWVGDLLDHVAESGAAVDFLSTHAYGQAPLDVGAEAAARGRGELPVWWTEWGVSPRHFAPVNDAVFGAPFVARGMKAAHGRAESLAYWVVSDHFEELGRPPRLLHGGFGLLTVGNLRKPRWWAIAMLERLGDELLACELSGDGAEGMVDAWATRDADGRIAVAVWNGTLDQSKVEGDPLLDRRVELEIGGLPATRYGLRHHRVDRDHSNIGAVWARMGGGDWPDEAAWEELRRADRLEELEPERTVTREGDRLTLSIDLPMPSMSLLVLVPDGA